MQVVKLGYSQRPMRGVMDQDFVQPQQIVQLENLLFVHAYLYVPLLPIQLPKYQQLVTLKPNQLKESFVHEHITHYTSFVQ
jgi:hypothetical protein